MLRPTLQEPSIFYRTAHIDDDYSTIEMFDFSDGEFKFINNVDLLFEFQGCLLNRRFLFCESRSHSRSSNVEGHIFDLELDEDVIFDLTPGDNHIIWRKGKKYFSSMVLGGKLANFQFLFQMTKREVNCLFVLGIIDIPLSFTRRKQRLETLHLPLICTITLFCCWWEIKDM
ncbi:hypothetical protein PCE1_001886 [Barthelona sp. PCE]